MILIPHSVTHGIFLLNRMSKKSWFGALMGNEREEHHFVMVRDKPLSEIKADLIHAFLSVSTSQ